MLISFSLLNVVQKNTYSGTELQLAEKLFSFHRTQISLLLTLICILSFKEGLFSVVFKWSNSSF